MSAQGAGTTGASGAYATPEEAFDAGAIAGVEAARREAMAERNRLARLCAEANDERDEERRQHDETRDLLSIRDDNLVALMDEFERVTGRDWTAEQVRSWQG